jgi:hypothetical protein
MKYRRSVAALTLSVLASLGAAAHAQERPERLEGERGSAAVRREPLGHAVPARSPGLRLDERYHHDHYYPPRGQMLAALPNGSLAIGFRGDRWFFHGGVWFRPVGSRFVVGVPPLGIVVPVLPPDYATLWIGGLPYYYANDVYYAPVPGQGYAVVAPPPGADVAQPLAAVPKALPDPIIYPRNGQDAARTESDREDCNRWATTQPSALADASVFQRSVAACMDAKGYTVR